MSKWIDSPPDRTGYTVSILPPTFDTKAASCVLCGGTLDFDWICTRCGADHFPAVKRLIKRREEAKS